MENEVQFVIHKEGFGISSFSNAPTEQACKRRFRKEFKYVGNFDGSDGYTILKINVGVENFQPTTTKQPILQQRSIY